MVKTTLITPGVIHSPNIAASSEVSINRVKSAKSSKNEMIDPAKATQPQAPRDERAVSMRLARDMNGDTSMHVLASTEHVSKNPVASLVSEQVSPSEVSSDVIEFDPDTNVWCVPVLKI
jgi:hypothetical protein